MPIRYSDLVCQLLNIFLQALTLMVLGSLIYKNKDRDTFKDSTYYKLYNLPVSHVYLPNKSSYIRLNLFFSIFILIESKKNYLKIKLS